MDESAAFPHHSLFSQFANNFIYWFEPTGHDFLRCYMSCIFVASTDEENPVEELERLKQQQIIQQVTLSCFAQFCQLMVHMLLRPRPINRRQQFRLLIVPRRSGLFPKF
jgi:hypothetical protein